MIPAGGCPLSPQTSIHLLLQEGPARAAGFKAQENGMEVWDCPSRRLQKAQARGQGGAGRMSMCHQEPEAGTPSPQGEQGELDLIFLEIGKLIYLLKIKSLVF